MKREMNILNLEDDIEDAELIERELRKADMRFRIKRVVTQEAFLLALQEDPLYLCHRVNGRREGDRDLRKGSH